MLYYLAELLTKYWGPFRLLQSHALLLAGGTFLSGIMVWWLLPRLWDFLPRDRGKVICKDLGGMTSAGKPTGAGVLVSLVVLPVVVLFAPLAFWDYCALGAIYAAMLFGYLDDRAAEPWGELKKGLLDAVCAVAIAFFVAKGHSTLVWLPFVKGMWVVPLWIYVPAAAFILWFTMNATNCSDGVDGLAGALTAIELVILAVMLYVVIGYKPVAHYFLLPCNPEAARWAILVMSVAGGFGGYLWFNAEPSKVLMGDAGSRFLGIIVGTGSLVTGNPLLVLAFAPVILVNGGGGLAKLVLLRVARKLGRDIDEQSVIRRIRFPLHDHCKKNLGWTNAQVLMRFMLLQVVVMPVLLV
ncbi:MAG: phospho-N-acetylmuramoyl-pentapeptide-transferase, partial [Kiritimatiellae bacterium]|nr:phospho-N-acetylmuramoyl-pentapeptide-transferase [Kiritimatiellia bacterium]